MALRRTILVCLLLTIGAFACVKEIGFSPGGRPPPLPQNVRIYPAAPPNVWNALMDSLRLEYLFQIDVENPKEGYFVTRLIPDSASPQTSRYRLSGTVQAAADGTAVTLYRERQVLTDGAWKSLPSDYVLEQKILEELKSRLR